MTQRVFAGESLCRDPKWVTIALLTQGIATDFKKLEAVVNCAAGFRSVAKLWQTNWFLRSFVAWRDKSLKGLRNHRKIVKRYQFPHGLCSIAKPRNLTVSRLLLPVLDERLKSMENPLFKPPTDLIQLLIDTNPQGIGRSIGHHTDAQINTGRAALFTTSISTFHLVYDLAAHPECIEPLRQELAELGDVAYSEYNVSKLVKLDSFIRECQRWSSLTMSTLNP